MARAKNTERAAARRRHREQQRTEEQLASGESAVATTTATATAAPAQPTTSLTSAMKGSMRMPNIREDLRILPSMLARTPKLWIPFIILGVSFILALLLPTTVAPLYLGDGLFIPGHVQTSVLPSGLDKFAALFVQLTLPPTSLFVFFIGGFLAPRASYLVGAVLGIVDGVLWAAYVIIANSSAQELTSSATPSAKPTAITDVLVLILFAVFIGVLAAGFAAWYRNFLRQSNERARQNRLAREQAAKAKAKEDERIAREEQRKAAAAAREEQRKAAAAAKSAPKASPSAAPSTPSASTSKTSTK
ncbi:MAG: hypothetical protein U0869_00940 [Chloroflexota bacterium]